MNVTDVSANYVESFVQPTSFSDVESRVLVVFTHFHSKLLIGNALTAGCTRGTHMSGCSICDGIHIHTPHARPMALEANKDESAS